MNKTFTPEETRPSEYTIRLIKLIARSYHAFVADTRHSSFAVN